MGNLRKIYDRFQGLAQDIVATAIILSAVTSVALALQGVIDPPWAIATVSAIVLALAVSVLAHLRWRKRPDPSSIPIPAATAPTGLPMHDPAGFFGRTTEMATVIASLLARRSLLIHGEPGIGKTSLSVQSLGSRQIQQAYKGRIHYVDLEGRSDVSLAVLCDEVARLLKAQAVMETQDVSQKIPILIANLGSPPPLLVFNNADGPDAVAAVADFRQRVMDGPLLVTSRDAIPGMTTLELGPLNSDAALRLFARHAGREPSSEERQAVGGILDILVILDGNPQAIILTAGVFKDMSAADLLKALRSRPFDVVGPVRAAFDVSYDRLSQRQQRLFAALAVFAGPSFSSEAVQSLFDQDTALDMARLCGESLLRRDQPTGRYSLHPLLREYAKGKLGDPDSLQLRLAAFYAQFTGAHDQPTEEHLNALSQDFPNIRGSLEWCIGSKDGKAAPSFVAMVISTAQFMNIRGYWAGAITWGEAAVEAAKALNDDNFLARVTHTAAIAFQNQGHPEEARDYYQQSLDIKKRLGDQQGIAHTLHQLGMLDEDAGRLHEAQHQFGQALAIFERLGSPDAATARDSLQRVQDKLKGKGS